MTEDISLGMESRSFHSIERKALVGFAVLITAALIQIVGLKIAGISILNTKLYGSATSAAHEQQQLAQELVQLRANGFVTTEVNRAGGVFALVVELGKDFRDEEITMQVKSADGNVVYEMQIAAGIPVQSQDVNLQSGQYTLEVVTHPQWICHLNIQ